MPSNETTTGYTRMLHPMDHTTEVPPRVPPGPRPRVHNNTELAAKLIELAHALHAMGCHEHVATCKDAVRRLRGEG